MFYFFSDFENLADNNANQKDIVHLVSTMIDGLNCLKDDSSCQSFKAKLDKVLKDLIEKKL